MVRTFSTKPDGLDPTSHVAARAQDRSPFTHAPDAPFFVPLPHGPSPLQLKAAVSEPGDVHEREADRAAEQVITGGTPPHLQRSSENGATSGEGVPARVTDLLAEQGTPLEPSLRRDMERGFDRDFSGVRVHSSAAAQDSAREMSARAYTLGTDIVFGAGSYSPDTREGRRLIAHELSHVVQQTGAGAHSGVSGKTIMRSPADDPAPADQTADDVPAWVKSILLDRNTTFSTKMRAIWLSLSDEPKSEEEFIALMGEQAAQPNPDTEPGLSSDEAAKLLTEHFIRKRAVEKVGSMMGADWGAPEGSEAFIKAQNILGGKLPPDIRGTAMTTALIWVDEHREELAAFEDKLVGKRKISREDREKAEAANYLIHAINTVRNAGRGEKQYSEADDEHAKEAWKYLGVDQTKKHLEKVGYPLAWFTTCVTVPGPVAEAAGVDTKKWGPLDMFHKRTQERFKAAEAAEAWVPAEKKVQPKPGDIIVFVSYHQKDLKGVLLKSMDKATFQHVAVLVEPVTVNDDGTERWVTGDGGKGISTKGEDKTGTTVRRYNPAMLQFIPEQQTNLQEAAQGGRYLLGFWNITLLPRRPEPPVKGAKK